MKHITEDSNGTEDSPGSGETFESAARMRNRSTIKVVVESPSEGGKGVCSLVGDSLRRVGGWRPGSHSWEFRADHAVSSK